MRVGWGGGRGGGGGGGGFIDNQRMNVGRYAQHGGGGGRFIDNQRMNVGGGGGFIDGVET